MNNPTARHRKPRQRRSRWVGPLFAIDALLVLFATKREYDAATRSQLAQIARGETP